MWLPERKPSLCRFWKEWKQGVSYAHELRNGVVKELISQLMGGSPTERKGVRRNGGRSRGVESAQGRTGGEARKRRETGQKDALGEANSSEERQHSGRESGVKPLPDRAKRPGLLECRTA